MQKIKKILKLSSRYLGYWPSWGWLDISQASFVFCVLTDRDGAGIHKCTQFRMRQISNHLDHTSLDNKRICFMAKKNIFLQDSARNPNVKPWPNDRNRSMEHIATSLGATCCVCLTTVLRCVATCWVLLAQVWNWSNLSQQHPTPRNMSQYGGQMYGTCCDMLCWHVAIVWPGLNAF